MDKQNYFHFIEKGREGKTRKKFFGSTSLKFTLKTKKGWRGMDGCKLNSGISVGNSYFWDERRKPVSQVVQKFHDENQRKTRARARGRKTYRV